MFCIAFMLDKVWRACLKSRGGKQLSLPLSGYAAAPSTRKKCTVTYYNYFGRRMTDQKSEQSKVISIHLFGLTLMDVAYCTQNYGYLIVYNTYTMELYYGVSDS